MMKINDEVLISYVLNEADPVQIIAVEKWLEEDSGNIRTLDQFRLIWELSNTLKLEKQMNAGDSLQRFKHRSLRRQTTAVTVLSLPRSYRWVKAAAAILLVTGGIWWLYLQRNLRQVITSTARLEVKADTLSDGSVVTLNQNTVFTHAAHFRGDLREVVLKNGEAFFSVQHLADKPFVVRTANLKIQVLGTSFNVKSKPGSAEVLVETGLVAVTNDVETILLRPGDKLNIRASSHKMVVSRSTDRLYQYYRTKEFIADGTSLGRLVAALNEAYDSRIIIANPKLTEMKLNTTFRDDSLDDILDVVSRTFHIRVVRSGDAILLK